MAQKNRQKEKLSSSTITATDATNLVMDAITEPEMKNVPYTTIDKLEVFHFLEILNSPKIEVTRRHRQGDQAAP